MERERKNSKARWFFLSTTHYAWSPETRRINQKFYIEEKSLFYTLIGKPERVLDVPCGDGRLTELLVKKGCDVVAADISKEQIRRARNRRMTNVEFIVCDAEKLPRRYSVFDLIVVWDALHYLTRPESFLKELSRISISNSGRILMNVSIQQSKMEQVLGKILRRIYYIAELSRFRLYLSDKYGLPTGEEGDEPAVAGVAFTVDEFHKIVRSSKLKLTKELFLPEKRPLHLVSVAKT